MTAVPRLAMHAELDALEARMGELAALLSEMADALTSYPESIRILEAGATPAPDNEAVAMLLPAREWPTIQEIDQLLANWRRLREMADRG